MVVGQPNFVTGDAGCDAISLAGSSDATIAAGKLIVADGSNNRVLIWNSVPTTNEEPANVILGQNSFNTCARNDDDQNGIMDAGPTARTLDGPRSIWSDGERLVVADLSNNRVLIWNAIPTSNFTAADRVIGQADFVSSISGPDAHTFTLPTMAVSNGNQLFVVDQSNQRLLICDSFPTTNGASADRVLGQSTFTNFTHNDDDQDGVTDGNPTARTMYFPITSFPFEETLIVNDVTNNRFLIFESQ